MTRFLHPHSLRNFSCEIEKFRSHCLGFFSVPASSSTDIIYFNVISRKSP
jgi:hypothetical protein